MRSSTIFFLFAVFFTVGFGFMVFMAIAVNPLFLILVTMYAFLSGYFGGTGIIRRWEGG